MQYMKTSILTADDVKEAFKMLSDLSVAQLARDTELSRSYVSQVVNAKKFNRKVADKVMEYLEKDIATKERFEAIKKQIA
jgi:hypothetical protein